MYRSMADAPDSPDGPDREDFVQALRFIHAMEMQTRLQLERVDAMVAAIVRVLAEQGTLPRPAVEAQLERTQREARERNLADLHVKVGPPVDKYTLTSPPDLDCAALMPVCQGRCCRLSFSLSFQDLDEHSVAWEYGLPYHIRQRPVDGYCVHSDAETHRCGVYDKRPAICRTYDCRNDKRVWIDFANKIPAPMAETDRLIMIRKRDTQPPSSDDPPVQG